MLLKRLVLHGFKTFATRTVFEFQGGITAVIGPNGSGKSNLADAVRWVLGETSGSAVRARRGEDVIFAGTATRPAMGMAEASLTLDNADGLLPTEFSEVTITRRAYRDGEAQYLINGQRARLKDIQALTAPLGGAYTVVGQGLVDAALSQRPEERRGLFEHAAGITGHQMRRAEAERRLAAADANCQRLADILDELTPQLRTLERAARQASEATTVQAQLNEALRGWYGLRWRRLAAALMVAEAEAATTAARAATAEQDASDLEAERAAVRDRLVATRTALEARRAERDATQRDLSEATRRAAVAAERAVALARRLDDRAATAEAAAERATALDESLEAAAAALTALEGERLAAGNALRAAEAAAAETEDAARAGEHETARLRATLLEGARRIGSLEAEVARLQERLSGLAREAATSDQAARRRADDRAALAARRAALADEALAADADADARRIARSALDERAAVLAATRRESQARLAALDHEVAGARARLEALTRLRESGAGLAAGPRAVMAAARAGQLSGVLGTVATLVRTPAALETAIEAALGGHVNDIAVMGWADAEAAIALLKRSTAGRATFQPLDTLRPARPLPPERGPGILGAAATLVEVEARFKPLVEALLGRVLIVEDLPTAHELVRRGVGWTVVTRSGEIARPGGALTGGAAGRETGALAREREARDLPARLAALTDEREQAAHALADADADAATLATERETLAAELHRLTREADRRAHALSRLDADAAALATADAAAARSAADAGGRHKALQAEIDGRSTALAAAHADIAEAQAALDALAGRAAEGVAQREAMVRAVADGRAALARLDERRRALSARRAELTAERERAARDLTSAQAAQAAQGRERAVAEAEHVAQMEAHSRLARTLAAAEQAAIPLEAALGAEASTAEALDGRLAAARAGRLTAETAAGRARLAVEGLARERDEAVARLAADLPGTDPATLPDADTDDRALESAIADARARLRRLGTPDPDAIAQHAATRERHSFLTRELDDVTSAAKALRGTIAGLDDLMRRRFEETFAAVNDAFGRTFARLFGGGQARLHSTDEAAGGIEITAQPPGKRQQSLALLSGGERALTAAALLLAILEVNPSPFCLLDEVDAALDESNVVRLRGLLADLAARTQVVVITHNRGTIEGADTLYGISMGRDGVSQVISLRLDATRPAADD